MITKLCAQCQTEFAVTPDDFVFYKRIHVPVPTLCPTCRLCRRLAWRNEKTLYQRHCDLCQQTIISIYRSEAPFPVYCQTCWWKDDWNPLEYGQAYDNNQDFFAQWQRLRQHVPRVALTNTNSENSAYTNYAGYDKNCYLIFANASGHNENCAYGKSLADCRDSVDGLYLQDCELTYDCVNCQSCYRVAHAHACSSCSDAMYVEDCSNCQNCIGCKGLRNKQYCIFNQQYTQAEYERKHIELKLDTWLGQETIRQRWQVFRSTVPSRFAHMIQAENCTGDYITNATDCQHCFDVNDIEHSKYVNHAVAQVSDCYDVGSTIKADLSYECMSLVDGYNCRFCNVVWWSVRDLEYCDLCFYTQSCFGCIGLRKNQYCILNKQYTPADYATIVQDIKQQMCAAGGKGYGEFPPIQQSPFAYNESIAQEYLPLTETRVKQLGYHWYQPPTKSTSLNSLAADQLPNSIHEVDDGILNQTIVCVHQNLCQDQCSTVFKLIKAELELYRALNIPLPRFCFNCRHQMRLQQKGTMRLVSRQCDCQHPEHGHTQRCPVEFETTYTAERPEKIFCGVCYQKTIY